MSRFTVTIAGTVDAMSEDAIRADFGWVAGDVEALSSAIVADSVRLVSVEAAPDAPREVTLSLTEAEHDVIAQALATLRAGGSVSGRSTTDA